MCISDASKKTYAATIYLAQKGKKTHVKIDLVLAQSRLAR